MGRKLLLGDEACAMGAMDAGISAAYGYPGTPSTEIIGYLMSCRAAGGGIIAKWCANEKTAYEAAMGASYAGKRSLVAMKHVGLNVAFDAFVNSALQRINGGLVVAVADDPGMHSSQNEQDTRFLADFARVVCFEPRNHQDAYAMTRQAFDVSERHHIPVVIRLVTRLAHSRSGVTTGEPRKPGCLDRSDTVGDWMCIPSCARENYHTLLQSQSALLQLSEESGFNTLRPSEHFTEYGVISTGIGTNYFNEIAGNLPGTPPHLHIGLYPVPGKLVRDLAVRVKRLIVIEEGSPFVEEKLRSIIRDPMPISGKSDGFLPYEGELTPDIVARAFGVEGAAGAGIRADGLPPRPPQLCGGCPHHDTFALLREIVGEFPDTIITSDIGCYTLGALPPYGIIDSAVCMGASIGMAIGVAEAGYPRVIATIGDSTFFHSGLPGLVDAVSADVTMVLLILDNGTTAMTGGQETVADSARLLSLVRGAGVGAERLHVIVPLPANHAENVAVLRGALGRKGFSVVVAQRECVHVRKHERAGGAEA